MLYLSWLRTQERTHEGQSRDAHALLARMLTAIGLPTAPILISDTGRPYLSGQGAVDFSLSHTSGLVLCALETDGAARVGADVEKIPTDAGKVQKLTRRFFAPCEQTYVLSAKEPCAAFAEVFTAKEAYAKFTGEGLALHLRRTDTQAPGFEAAHGVRFLRYAPQGYRVTLCVRKEATEPILDLL